MQWAEINGRQRLLVGGKVNKFIPNPLFDPVAKPGSLDEYFRGKNQEAKDIRSLFGDLEPIRPEYRDRDACLSVMDQQGLDGCFLFPRSVSAWRKRSQMIRMHWSPPSKHSTGGSRRLGLCL